MGKCRLRFTESSKGSSFVIAVDVEKKRARHIVRTSFPTARLFNGFRARKRRESFVFLIHDLQKPSAKAAVLPYLIFDRLEELLFQQGALIRN